MNQKGSVPILFVIILLIVGLIFAYSQYKKSINTKKTANSGIFYQDLKVGLKKAFEK